MLSEPFWFYQTPEVLEIAAFNVHFGHYDNGVMDWMMDTAKWAQTLPLHKLDEQIPNPEYREFMVVLLNW